MGGKERPMTAKPIGVVKQIQALEGEEALIEAKTVHKGFRDASRRNRIEEVLSALHTRLREAHDVGVQRSGKTNDVAIAPVAGKQS
jgi:hypothetical protein